MSITLEGSPLPPDVVDSILRSGFDRLWLGEAVELVAVHNAEVELRRLVKSGRAAEREAARRDLATVTKSLDSRLRSHPDCPRIALLAGIPAARVEAASA